MMRISKFDPWALESDHAPAAYDAYSAYTANRIGRIGSASDLEIGTFEERAAVIEFCGGKPRSSADLLAAQEAGFADASSLHVGMIDNWCDRLCDARSGCGECRLLCDRGIKFCRGQWIGRLVAMGCDEISLFSVNLLAPAHGGLLQRLHSREILAITDSNAVLRENNSGRQSRCCRFAPHFRDLPLIWEMSK